MFNWTILWLYFRFESIIDWGKKDDLTLNLLPTVEVTISLPDHEGYRAKSIGLYFLIFGVVFSYYYPSLYNYNEEGEIVSKNSYPQFTIYRV